jgi:hypothetical protein
LLYGITLGNKEALERIVTGKEPEKLPPVLSPEEIACFLEAVAGVRNRVARATAYAAGEVLDLGTHSTDASAIRSPRRRAGGTAGEFNHISGEVKLEPDLPGEMHHAPCRPHFLSPADAVGERLAGGPGD